mmetsp:Transcript_68625/g.191234  ORF Transcript_68625/g.191234 Transcript_68625/m.191234 type:complete len:322 (+) Transcript_68625:551-1516(+)
MSLPPPSRRSPSTARARQLAEVERHDHPRHVEPVPCHGQKREGHVQEHHADNGVEVVLCFGEERQGAVAEVRDIKVSCNSQRPERVGTEGRREPVAEQQRQNHELHDVSEQERHEEAVAVDVEGIEPLHGLGHRVHRVQDEISIGEAGAHTAEHEPANQPVAQNLLDQQQKESHHGEPVLEARDTPGERRDRKEAELDHREPRVVACPLVLRLFAVVCQLVHLGHVLWRAHERHHLVECGVVVDLVPRPHPSQVLRQPLASGGVRVATTSTGPDFASVETTRPEAEARRVVGHSTTGVGCIRRRERALVHGVYRCCRLAKH